MDDVIDEGIANDEANAAEWEKVKTQQATASNSSIGGPQAGGDPTKMRI